MVEIWLANNVQKLMFLCFFYMYSLHCYGTIQSALSLFFTIAISLPPRSMGPFKCYVTLFFLGI